MKNLILTIAAFVLLTMAANAQEQITQTIRGIVYDEASSAPIASATITLPEITGKTVAANENGQFTLTGVPLGRHTVQISIIGYETVTLREVLVTSGKELYLEIAMKERVQRMDEIVVRPRVNKEETINTTAVAGARMLSMEEAGRYAGGADDPARLVAAFPGVSSGLSHNGISIHGNSPEMLQWRLEGIEIPNPNHYADVSTLGGGILSSLSSNVLGNSDFFSGAFPAEYANAVSGVFDMRMRNGNSHKHEHTAQIGLMGIDVASEGPFSRNGNASYMFNYRYSTLGLISKIDPSLNLGGSFDYQDINFKLNLPTRRAGTFSLWGTGLIDKFGDDNPKNPADWVHHGDNLTFDTKQYMGAAGMSHTYRFAAKGQLKTTLAVTAFDHRGEQISLAFDLTGIPYYNMSRRNTNIVLTSAYNHKFGAKHTNRTGFTYTRMLYDMNLSLAPSEGEALATVSRGSGATDLINVFTNSTLHISNRLSANIGVSSQILTLNGSQTIEPRAGLKYLAGRRTTLALAYGLHSRMERLDLYYVHTGGGAPVNTGLDFTKAHHLMFTYAYKINDNTILRVEPYYQHLFDIPVENGSSYSVINREEYYAEKALVNRGLGRNYGVDLTLEQYLVGGFYYMFTGSVFNSEYKGGDSVWRDTRYNRNYIVNGLAGKEWMLGRSKKHTLNANVKLTMQGGARYTPVDEAATLSHPDKEIRYDETRAFAERYDPMFITNVSVSYRFNRPRTSHEFGIVAINLTGASERYGFHYNHSTGIIEENKSTNGFKNIYYRIHF